MFVLQSDAYSVCLICHNDLSQGSGGTRELQCTHTFHKEVTHSHTLTHTYAHAVSVTHPHTRTPSHCAAPSHTYTHTPSHVCAEAERCLLLRLFLGLSLKHTHGHTLCSRTQQNQTGLLSPTSGDSCMSSGGTASTVRHGYLPAPPTSPIPLHLISSPSLPPSLSPSIHSSLILPAVRRHAWLKDTALGSAVV